jgi:hypothetical protein
MVIVTEAGYRELISTDSISRRNKLESPIEGRLHEVILILVECYGGRFPSDSMFYLPEKINFLPDSIYLDYDYELDEGFYVKDPHDMLLSDIIIRGIKPKWLWTSDDELKAKFTAELEEQRRKQADKETQKKQTEEDRKARRQALLASIRDKLTIEELTVFNRMMTEPEKRFMKGKKRDNGS